MPATAEVKRPIPAQKHKPSLDLESGATWQPTADERSDLTAIDATVDRIRSLTAPDPYILTIPQDVEPRYNHSYRLQAEQWLYKTPFSSTEPESSQYQTFHYYEHGAQMYVQQNSRPQEPIRTPNPTRPHHPSTGASTPTPGPKKTISLDAYKKKQSGCLPTPDSSSTTKESDAIAAKQAALKGPIERVKAETEEMLAAVAESEDLQRSARKDEPQPERKDLKRKWEEKGAAARDEKLQRPEKHSASRAKAVEPAIKRPRRSPSPTQVGAKANGTLSQTSKGSKIRPKEEHDETKLPPRLSPGMPPRLSPLRHTSSPKPSSDNAPPSLPPMLSPTIPGNISKTLRARGLYHNGSKDGKLIKKTEEAAKRQSPVPRNGFRTNLTSPVVRSDAEDRLRPPASPTPRKPPSPAPSPDEDLDRSAKAKAARPSRLLVKLRYKKSQREGIGRILKTRPTPSKRPPSPPPLVRASREAKQEEKSFPRRNGEHKADKVGKTVAPPVRKEVKPPGQDSHRATVSDKRPLPDEDRGAPSAKRRETATSSAQKEPSTPARSQLPSPLAPSSTRKGHLPPTPNNRKETTSHPLNRQPSQESLTVPTSPNMSATPRGHGNTSHTGGPDKVKTPEQQAWEAEQKRFEELGRDLKHSASAHLTSSPATAGAISVEAQKQVAAKALASLLCYFFAFTCADEAAALAAGLKQQLKQQLGLRLWRSTQDLYTFTKRRCETFPILSGLASALGISLNAHIISLLTEQSASDSAVDGELLVQVNRALKRTALDADIRFNRYIIAKRLPVTWRAQSKSLPPPDSESMSPTGLLSGPWGLPIDFITPPYRAARAGHAVLREWLSQEGMNIVESGFGVELFGVPL